MDGSIEYKIRFWREQGEWRCAADLPDWLTEDLRRDADENGREYILEIPLIRKSKPKADDGSRLESDGSAEQADL